MPAAKVALLKVFVRRVEKKKKKGKNVAGLGNHAKAFSSGL